MEDRAKHLALEEVRGGNLCDRRREVVSGNACSLMPRHNPGLALKPLHMRLQPLESFGIDNRPDIGRCVCWIADR